MFANKVISKAGFIMSVSWAGLSLLSGCGRPPSEPEPRLVETVVAAAEPAIETALFYGRTEPKREVVLSFRVPGQIHLLEAKKGREVVKDQLIAQLDLRDYKIKLSQAEGGLKQAEAQLRMLRQGAREEDLAALQSRLEGAGVALRKARLNYQRHLELLEEDTITKAEYDRVKTELATAGSEVETLEQELKKARTGGREEEIDAAVARLQTRQGRLEAAQAALDDATLATPFAGRITERLVDNYQNVEAGTPIAILQDTSRLKVEIGLPEQMRPQAEQKVKAVRCRIDAWPEHALTAVITEISSDTDPITRTYPATIEFEVPEEIEAWPGMSVEVEIDFKKGNIDQLFIVPSTALINDSETGEDFVWIVEPEDSTVTRRIVEVKAITSRGIEIEAGLREGELIIAAGGHFLREGRKVRVR